MSKRRSDVERLTTKLRSIYDEGTDEETTICAKIFHDGSYVIIEYKEGEEEDAFVLDSGETVTELDIFIQRKMV